MISPKTIDISTSNILFNEQDPVGLLPEASASSYLRELRQRLSERYPKANVFLRWSPSTNEPTNVFTLPPEAVEAKKELHDIAEQLRKEDSEEWLRYDENVREMFAS